MEKKLEKNFLLETRYENDKKRLKPFLIISIIIPIYWPMYLILRYLMKKYYEEVSQMRDEQREIELLNIIQTKKYKNQKYIYAHYALIDLGNKQVKNLVIEKIIKQDRVPFQNDISTARTSAYGKILAYIEKREQEEKWGKERRKN
ncbi:MAG: hypothetical protein FK732_07735 [Asgard group archaeon]|nr:hypothetical protein [Asgard group archaeon]